MSKNRHATLAFIALCHALLLLPGSAAAQGDAEAEAQVCADAYHKTQELRIEGKLRAARDQAATCAKSSCPTAVRDGCAKWLPELRDAIPTIVISARDGDGKDVTDVKVFVDEELIAESLTGFPIELDPGRHALRLEREGEPPVNESIVVTEGAKNRPVDVTIGAPSTPLTTPDDTTPSEHDDGLPPGPFILGGLGIAALGAFAGLAIVGTQEVDDMRGTCGLTHSCPEEDIDSARNKLIAGDVLLAVGAGLIGAGVIWLAVDRAQTSGGEQAALGIRPALGGATFVLGF
jgi:hypothetical protein